MTAEVPVAETDEERVQKILKEADLFINSKKEVERSFVDRVLRVFNLIVFCLAAVCNVLAAVVVIFGYGLRYPSVYLDYKGFLQIFIILYALCPTVISLVNLCIMKRYPGRKKILTRVLSGVLVPAVLAGLIGTVSLFLIPPFCSATSRITAYMKVDKDVEDSVRPLPFAFRLPFRRPQRPRFTITVNFPRCLKTHGRWRRGGTFQSRSLKVRKSGYRNSAP